MTEENEPEKGSQQLTIMFLLILIAILSDGVKGSEVAVMHYGHFGGLSLTCQRDELILMESEVLGYSTNRGCNPQPLCSVPYTLAKWYCRGKSTCGGMQVERRPLHKRTCGSEFTNCLRVEYQCIPMSKLTDICSDTIYEAADGYISSPDFPDMYPPDKNCTCSLTPANNEHVQIDTAFFLLKSSRPCHDWLRITVDNDGETTRCGYIPEQKRYIGKNVNINFVSDGHDTEMGFWLRFTGTGGGPVKVRCGRYVNTDDTVTPSPKPKSTRRMYKPRYTTRYLRKKISTATTDPPDSSTTSPTEHDFTDFTPEPNNRAGRYSSTKKVVPVTEIPDPENPREKKIEGKRREDGGASSFSSEEQTQEIIYQTSYEDEGEVRDIEEREPEEEGDYIYEETREESEEVGLSDSEVLLKPAKESKELSIVSEEEEVLGDKLHVVEEFMEPGLDEREKVEEDQGEEMINMGEVDVETISGPPKKNPEEKQMTMDNTIEPNPRENSDNILIKETGQDPDVNTFWTSSDYVDLDADYEEERGSVIDMSDPGFVKDPTTERPRGKETTVEDGSLSTAVPMVHFVHQDETMTEKEEFKDSENKKTDENFNGEGVDPFDRSDLSNVNEDISIAQEADLTDEVMPNDYNSKNLEGYDSDPYDSQISEKFDSGPYDSKISEDFDSKPHDTQISEGYNSEPYDSNPDTILLSGNDPNLDSEDETSALGGMDNSRERTNPDKTREYQNINEESMIAPSSDVAYDEAVLTGDLIDVPDNGFILNGGEEKERVLLEPSDVGSDMDGYGGTDDQDSTGRLLLAPTDYPQTIKDSENVGQSQKPLPSLQPSTTTPGYVQSIDDFSDQESDNEDDEDDEETVEPTPFDWRLTLSKAGYDYEQSSTTMDPFVKTTTPDEMLHYVHSGKPFTDKNSIATGEFLPVGDIISLIDEKDITTTVTTTVTTTPPPEIFTLLGGLTPIIPLNTIGKGFKPLLIPAKKVTTSVPSTPAPTEMMYPTGPEDLAGLFEETPWRSFGVNTSWIPPMVLGGDDMVVPQEQPVTEPPYNMPEAIRSTSGNKDLMWVLIVIAIVLWVVFMALLALLIYHRRKRLACLRGNHPQRQGSDLQTPISKHMFVPPLSAPITPGFRRPCHHHTAATQTGASRLASAMSWNSSSTGGPLVHDQRPPNPSPTTWSYNDDSSRSITPASPTPSDIRAASTQTLLPVSDRNSCAVQTDISGTLGRFNASMKARTSAPTPRRNAPLPPVPMPQNSSIENSPQEGLRHVPPITYAHTILRNIPGDSPTRGSLINPPYAESTTDLTTNDLNQNDNSWVTMDPFSPQYNQVHIYGSLPADDGRGRVATPQTRPRAKTLNINTRPSQKKKVHRLSGLPPPPPPPDFSFGPDTSKSRKSSINSSIRDQTYSTIKPRARPRASSTSSQSNIPGVNPDCSMADLLTKKWDKAQENEPDAFCAPPPKQFDGEERKAAPVLCFPPPPPPTPPPLPSRLSSPGLEPSSDEDNERSHPVGCEASVSPTDPNPSHLKRGISTPNVQDLETETDNLLKSNQDLLKGESAPQLNRGESPEEKLKGLVPQQAFFFNDKVQPELRRILSKRRFGSEPVQV